MTRSSWWSASWIDCDLRVRPVLVRVRVVVGQRQQQEVEEVVLDQVRAHAAGVLVAQARHPELALAAGRAARVDVGVEELARAEDRAAEERLAGDARERAVARDRRARGGRGTSGTSSRPSAARRRRAYSNTVGVASDRCSMFML